MAIKTSLGLVWDLDFRKKGRLTRERGDSIVYERLFPLGKERKEKIHMEHSAPGKGKLKVTGIIYIVLGALGLLLALISLGGGGILMALGGADAGVAVGAVVMVLGVLAAISAILYLILGILGVKNCDRPEKCGANFVLGIVLLVLLVISIISEVAMLGIGSAVIDIVVLVLSIVYLMGAKQNRDAAKAAVQ